jgi:hypothetical protein
VCFKSIWYSLDESHNTNNFDRSGTKQHVGWVKLGSFGTKEGTTGCGMVLRDDQGDIIFSACRFLPRCVKVVEAKLLACREGLEPALESISNHGPGEAPDSLFFIQTAKNGTVAPSVPRFARIWAFIHPASPGHPRPSGARSGTTNERNARETAKKVPMRLVAPTCWRERAVVILIASSSAHHRLPAHLFRVL